MFSWTKWSLVLLLYLSILLSNVSCVIKCQRHSVLLPRCYHHSCLENANVENFTRQNHPYSPLFIFFNAIVLLQHLTLTQNSHLNSSLLPSFRPSFLYYFPSLLSSLSLSFPHPKNVQETFTYSLQFNTHTFLSCPRTFSLLLQLNYECTQLHLKSCAPLIFTAATV